MPLHVLYRLFVHFFVRNGLVEIVKGLAQPLPALLTSLARSMIVRPPHGCSFSRRPGGIAAKCCVRRVLLHHRGCRLLAKRLHIALNQLIGPIRRHAETCVLVLCKEVDVVLSWRHFETRRVQDYAQHAARVHNFHGKDGAVQLHVADVGQRVKAHAGEHGRQARSVDLVAAPCRVCVCVCECACVCVCVCACACAHMRIANNLSSRLEKAQH